MMDMVALALGWALICIVAIAGSGLLAVAIWHYFPCRFDWFRPKRVTVDVAGRPYAVNWWIGMSNRRSPSGWFFGFQHYSPATDPKAGPRVTTPKAPSPTEPDQ